MIREKLCAALKKFKCESGLTYSDLTKITGLNRTQLSNIINNNGAEVKLETIEDALYYCKIEIEVRCFCNDRLKI